MAEVRTADPEKTNRRCRRCDDRRNGYPQISQITQILEPPKPPRTPRGMSFRVSPPHCPTDVMTAGTDIHRFRRLRRFLSRQRTPRTPRGMSFRVSPPHCPTGDVEANEESSRPAADGADGPGSDTRAPGPLHCRTGAAAANPCSHSLWCRCRLLRTYHRENGLGGGRRSGRGPMRSISSNPSPIAAPSFRPRNV
jgi:hypothetical protein